MVHTKLFPEANKSVINPKKVPSRAELLDSPIKYIDTDGSVKQSTETLRTLFQRSLAAGFLTDQNDIQVQK